MDNSVKRAGPINKILQCAVGQSRKYLVGREAERGKRRTKDEDEEEENDLEKDQEQAQQEKQVFKREPYRNLKI